MNASRLLLKGLLFGATLIVPVVSPNMEQIQGEVWSWGSGKNGELGIGSETNLSLPQGVKSWRFKDIDAKKSLSAGITTEGKLVTWGKNRNGVLGHSPPNLNVLIPREIEFPSQVAQVSCGYQHMCVVTKKGEAYVFGIEQKTKFRVIGVQANSKGQKDAVPVKIELPDVTQVACANDYIILVDKHGQVFRVDDSSLRKNVTNAEVVKLDLSGVTKISCGINFSLALTDTGKVFVWGNNTCGQLGTGGLTNEANPVQLQALNKEVIVDVCCGDNYSGVVTDKGEVYTWGFGNEGQLGHGDKSDQFLPRKIKSAPDKIKAISCGGAHTALLSDSGKLFLMGRGREGQLGREQNDESNSGYSLKAKPVQQLPQNGHILKVACGGTHTLVLLQNNFMQGLI